MNAPTTLSLPDISRILWGRKWLVIWCGLIGAVLAFALSLALPKQYQAEGNWWYAPRR